MTDKKTQIVSLTRTMEAVQERAQKLLDVIKNFPVDGDIDELENKTEVVDDLRSQLRESRSKLFGLVKQDDIVEINVQGFAVEEVLDECRFLIRRRVKMVKPTVTDTSVKGEVVESTSQAKLPDIPLPKFDGHYENWLYFRNQFNAIIRRRDNLDDFERLHYLRMCLCGEARDIQCDEETFTSLWNALLRRYENKRWLTEKHLGDVFRIPAMTSENAPALRSLVDSFLKHIRALSSLGFELDRMSELIFVQMVMMRLDTKTRRAYEADLGESEVPSWSKMVNFLGNHCRMLENLDCLSKSCVPSQVTRSAVPPNKNRYPTTNRPVAVNAAARDPARITCFLCRKNHYINQCEAFLQLSPKQRSEKIKSLNLCFNCLSHNHTAAQCTRSLCRVCQKKHHTLLHLDASTSLPTATIPNSSAKVAAKQSEPTRPLEPTVSNSSVSQPNRSVSIRRQILLNTAIVYLEDSSKELRKVRVLLDSGSMCNFITETCVQRLNLRKVRNGTLVTGICGSTSSLQSKVCVTIRSTTSDFETDIECLVTTKITAELPTEAFKSEVLQIPEKLSLADPTFNTPDRIDVLLGMDIYTKVMASNRIPLLDGSPVLQETVLGWVVGGKVEIQRPLVAALVTNQTLDDTLRKFWELEGCDIESKYSAEEILAEQHFLDTHFRDADGRYVVELPFKPNCPDLGDSKAMAMRRLKSTEKRLNQNWSLAGDYVEFMNEYIALGHMYRVGRLDELNLCSGEYFFLPHHAVEKPDSSTTKCRVVFDGSAATTNGRSLNDNLLVGPVIQSKLSDVVLRFRVHKVAFTADLSKMYRQVMIAEKHHPFQQILWRTNDAKEPDVYRLSTVTYGLSSAPFQAVRAVKQLCQDEERNFPLAAQIVQEDSYIDDLLSGADTVDDAVHLKNELIALFERGKFELHKWCSNSNAFLQQLPNEKIEQKLLFDENQAVKTLGIIWKPGEDVFMFNVNSIIETSQEATKRAILSEISRFYDPIGLAGPIILVAKLLMQSLWKKNVKWDERVDEEDLQKWIKFKLQLKQLREVKVSRCIFPFKSISVQIHGFCDASKYAYGACIYLRSTNEIGQVNVCLVCSKSRVAPIERSKKRSECPTNVTIPRLELCGALLLAQLVTEVTKSLKIPVDDTMLWCDSTIALAWIAKRSEQLKQFVSNRVIKIQALTSTIKWRHVGTNDNPADIISRGLMPEELGKAELWWRGPKYLTRLESAWPQNHREPEEIPEMEPIVNVSAELPAEVFPIFTNCSSYRRMIRVMMWVQRFIRILKKEPNVSRTETMSSVERATSLQHLVKLVQREAYPELVRQFEQGKQLVIPQQLVTLSPVFDAEGVLRVGGRLRHKSCSFDMKHQYILPPYHKFTEAIIRDYHRVNLHSGNQLTLASTRETFWIVHGKSAVKRFSCLRFFRHKPKLLQQYMGDLPMERVELVYPFYNTGVDFCGPVYLKPAIRSTSRVKAYICVFVCLATKAIHLELVGSLTSAAFIAALQRFVSRRGKCAKLFSDNATNFVGGNHDLRELYDQFRTQPFLQKLTNFTEDKAIQWVYIPPRAPSFGGLWEAGVRSLKYHLCRTIGEAVLTYEEMITVLTRIEATLNSRPLCALSDDPTDFNALTPGHFLVFRPLNSISEPELIDRSMHTLSRWERISQYVQHFWRRWNIDYVNQLQQRSKWHTKVPVAKGQLVVIREDNMPPQQWPLGRIEELFPGEDDIVRVVAVRTAKGVYKRALSRLSFLPIRDNELPVPTNNSKPISE